jgi:adenylate kinase family enzyme
MQREALLLVGPTGSGKTPLGDLLEQRGLWGRRLLHFDFGANLRRIVERDRPDAWLTRDALDFLAEVLRSGALLENESFSIARRVLESFLVARAAEAGVLVVLNGLPRHVGQAAAMAGWLDVRTVVELRCTPETVVARIQGNVGGDRAGRSDDELEQVRKKLDVYAQRTAPLVDYYRARGARIETLEVLAGTTAEEAWGQLDRRWTQRP